MCVPCTTYSICMSGPNLERVQRDSEGGDGFVVLLDARLHMVEALHLALHGARELLYAQLHGQVRVLLLALQVPLVSLLLLLLREELEVGLECGDLLLQGDVGREDLHDGHVRHGVGAVPLAEPLLDAGALVGQARRRDHGVLHHLQADRAHELVRDAGQVHLHSLIGLGVEHVL